MISFGITRSPLKSNAIVAPGAATRGPEPTAEPFENTKEPALTISEPVLELTPEYDKRPEPVFTKAPPPETAFARIESDWTPTARVAPSAILKGPEPRPEAAFTRRLPAETVVPPE